MKASHSNSESLVSYIIMMLVMLDSYTHESLALHVMTSATSFNGQYVIDIQPNILTGL